MEKDFEITQDMIEAGALEILRFDPRVELEDEVAERVYRVMCNVRGHINGDETTGDTFGLAATPR